MTPSRRLPRPFAALLLLILFWVQAGAAPALDGNVVRTRRQAITLDGSGLPAQIVIAADPEDLPLDLRAAGVAPGEADLQAIGRGPQLRAPLRLEAVVGGKTLVASPVKPAVFSGLGAVTGQSEMQAGPLRFTLDTIYGDGSFRVNLLCGAGAVDVDRLDLVMELASPVDLAVTGNPLDPAAVSDVGDGEGIVWSTNGLPAQAFVGSGDRGFSWMVTTNSFPVNARKPGMSLERDKAGGMVWRIPLVNDPVKLKGNAAIAFDLYIHPSRTKSPDRRTAGWLRWPGDPAALAWGSREPGAGMVRADAASMHEPTVSRAVLVGPAGGATRSTEETLADTFSLSLFRYLAAPHTGLSMQLRTNGRGGLPGAGDSPAWDRMAIGRALLHDIGVDPSGLGQLAGAANILRALDGFGYFKDDEKTEFLPYWRSGAVVRYGEAFKKTDAFTVTESNPAGRVHVSVFLRPTDSDPARHKALFVVVNEGDKPVREQFYILQPGRCFGGPNMVTAQTVIRGWDFSGIPGDSDWRQEVLIGSARPDRGSPPVHLRDLEDNGYVQARSVEGGMEIYGLLYVPARGMRLLVGAGAR
jgi:hypothetical protein